jgi:hypothetical protein
MENLSLAEFLTVLQAKGLAGDFCENVCHFGCSFLIPGLLLDVLGPCFASHSLRRLELLKAMPAGGGLDKKPVKPMEQLAAVSYVTMSGSLQLLDMDWNIMERHCIMEHHVMSPWNVYWKGWEERR